MSEQSIQNPEVYAEKRKNVDLARKQYLSDLGTVLKTPEGRRVLQSFLTKGKIFQLSFSAANERQTAFNEGRRSLALELVNDIAVVDPNTIPEALLVKHNL